ncbi:hypothetical protein FACS1894130_10330 [Spirochaetia bacterium]|nr:hypothetical protein FACS1894130_10330 [Spirochaetia bacterium]
MEFKFDGTITLQDYIQLNINHFKATLVNKKYILIYIILILSFSLFIGINIYNNTLISIINTIKDEYIFPVIVFIIIYFIFKRMQLKKLFDSNKILSEKKHYTITEDVIKIESESINDIITKEKINKIIYDKNTIYIYMSLTNVHLIKKRYLNNREQYIELKQFINKNYGKRF